MLTINTSASGTSETSGRTRRAGSGETSETSGSASCTGRDVGQVREVYTKEVAKCIYEELNKSTNVEETLKILAKV